MTFTKLATEKIRHFVVCPTADLRRLCIKNDWFTHGDNQQYSKMFDANHSPLSFTTEDIVTIIWVCSNASREDVRKGILEAQAEYEEMLKED